MSDWYQELDAPHFDYRVEAVDGIAEHRFRGPIPDLSRPYFACIGGAQTFGRFVADPYPQQLARSLGLPCLNLGLGGAGPRFARHPSVLRHLQQARFVVVQMFSGRSASNSRFDNTGDGRNFGRTIGSNREQRFEDFLRDMIELGDRALLERTVREQRDADERLLVEHAHEAAFGALGVLVAQPGVGRSAGAQKCVERATVLGAEHPHPHGRLPGNRNRAHASVRSRSSGRGLSTTRRSEVQG